MIYQLRETIGQLSGWNRMGAVYSALHHGSWEVRNNMASILSEYADEKVLKHLKRALKEEEADVDSICKAIEAYAVYHRDRDGASEILTIGLSNKNHRLRMAAVKALGRAGNLSSVKALLFAIQSNPKDDRFHFHAGASLAQIYEEYEEHSLKAEIDLLLNDDTFLGKQGILQILYPEEYTAEEIHKAWENDNHDTNDLPDSSEHQFSGTDKKLAYTFEEYAWENTHLLPPASGTFEELTAMLYSMDPEAQLSALHALRNLGDRRVTKTFNKLLGGLTTFYRHEMAEALGELQDPKSVRNLSMVFPGAWADLKLACIRSLRSIGGHSAQKTLILAIGDDLPKVRYLAAWALGNLKSQASVKALKNALTIEKYNYVRKQIESTLGNTEYKIKKP